MRQNLMIWWIRYARSFSAYLLLTCISGCGPAEQRQVVSDQAVLSQRSDDYPQAAPGRLLRFPQDHGEHPEYRIEWWYLTANLRDQLGRNYGAQFTLFRLALTPDSDDMYSHSGWANNQLYMGHAALTTPNRHFHAERFSRGGVGMTDVVAEPFVARIEQWQLASVETHYLPLALLVNDQHFALELAIDGKAEPALHGELGFSQKHPDKQVGSYYYSLPHLTVSGRVRANDEWQQVTGQAWLDREWSSQYLTDEQLGWDWLSLHLDNDRALMAFRLRQQDGNHFLYGSLVDENGKVQTLSAEQMQFEPVAWYEVEGRELPLSWQISVPSAGIEHQISALHPEQWMGTLFPYWEGAVLCESPDECRGYLELTGYSPDGE